MANSYDLYGTSIYPMEESDIQNATLMLDLLEEKYPIHLLYPTSNIQNTLQGVETSFQMYDSSVLKRFEKAKKEVGYVSMGGLPFAFRAQFGFRGDGTLESRVVCPQVFDDASYPFMGHEFHHVLKDTNPEERKYRNQLAEVIPMFYELVCADVEEEEIVKREILTRRIDLLMIDKENMENSYNPNAILQYFNSYYYALGLFSYYKDHPQNALRLVSKVLKHEISTMDLLLITDLYDNGMDSSIKEQFQDIKTYVKNG